MTICIKLRRDVRAAVFLALIPAVSLLAACGDDATLSSAPAPVPTSVSAIMYELEVVVQPEEAAGFILNPKPDSGGAFAAGTAVTIDVLPKEGWRVEKGVGPVFDEVEGSARVHMDTGRMVAVGLVRIETPTPGSTPGPTPFPSLSPTPPPTATPPRTSTPTLTPIPTPTSTTPSTSTPTPSPTSTVHFHLRVTVNPEGSGSVSVQPATHDDRYPEGTVVRVAAHCNLGFLHWSKDVPHGDSPTASSIEVIVDKDRHLEAICRELPITPAPAPSPATDAPAFNGSFDWSTYGVPKPTEFQESPILTAMVAAGILPPVEERLPVPSDVLVLPVIDRIGDYGGTWRRAFTDPDDGQKADRLMSDHILHFDLNGVDVIPNVVKGWEISDDGLTYTLFLREGLKWSDGGESTADDWVWYNENVVRNDEINPVREGQIGWSGFAPTVEKVDDYTVRLILPERGDSFLDELATYRTGGYTLHGRIADGLYGPSHFLKTIHRDFVSDTPAYDEMVMRSGSGNWPLFFKEHGDPLRSRNVPVMSPWKMTSPITSKWFEWERNPYYYAVDPAGNQLPYIDRISMPLWGNTEVLNLRAIAGEIDFQNRGIEMAMVPLFLENADKGNYRLRFWPSHNAQARITFNMTYGIGVQLNYEPDLEIQKWLHNKDFRIAMALAIDRQRINEVVFLGLGKVKNSTFTKGHPFYPGEEYEFKYTVQDVAEAKRILDTIGLDEKDSDGYRVRNDGRGTLVFEVAYNAEHLLDYSSAARLVAEDWSKIGIKTVLSPRNLGPVAQVMGRNRHEIVVGGGWSERHAMSLLDSNNTWPAYRTWYGFGKKEFVSGHPTADPTDDPILARIVELTDEAQTLRYAHRAANYIELQKLNIDNQWVIGLVGDTPAFGGVIVMKNYFRNVPLIAPNQTPLQNPGIGRPQTWFMDRGKNDSE